METILILLIGFLFGCGVFLMLRRNFTRMLIGILFISQAGNLALFVVPGLGPGTSPIVGNGQSALSPGYADPLPQALILTAIVIGFGMIAFTMVLVKKTYHQLHTDDLDTLTRTDS